MNPTFLIIDLFCGFGGTTTGFASATYQGSKIAQVIACINHDPKAIKSHWLNHPEVQHFEEDIRTLDLSGLIACKNKWQAIYPDSYVILWASLECTNFSKAKGGQPRNADSRTLAEHLFRYQEAIDPDYIMIENVTEFQAWGPLDEAGKPVSRKCGLDYMRWRSNMCTYGYHDQWTQLNSADFGAYTSRNRLFGCFAKHGLPITFPTPTHAKKASGSMFEQLQKWKPVKDVLDFSDEGESIFGRKKSMSEKTLEVISKGIKKAIAEGNDNILFKYYGKGDNLNSINEPAGTITTKDRFAKLCFIFRQYKTGYTSSINEPLGTIPTNPKANLISFIMNKSHGGHTTSINQPCPVIIARQDKAPLYLIRALMDENGIVDIKHRMLRVHELLEIQGFPKEYQMHGTQTDAKKFIGNSVVPIVVQKWAEALAHTLINQNQKIA
jgi:DNA (cytosine-5)-methyltransferase 1